MEIRRRLNVEPAGFAGVTAVINGDIRVFSDAIVEFGGLFTARNGVGNQGSVTVNGELQCFGNQGQVSFGGVVLQVLFPSAADRAASQCNDFNGNVVFPTI